MPPLQAALETARRHGRALLSLQGERLRASLLAAAGNWPAAEACFHQGVAQATQLDLPLEIARTQVAWGQAALRYSPSPHQGYTLLSQVEPVLAEHQAEAELKVLRSVPFK